MWPGKFKFEPLGEWKAAQRVQPLSCDSCDSCISDLHVRQYAPLGLS